MSTIAHERPAGPRAPRFLATAWDAFVGFLLAALAIGVVVVAATTLGLVGSPGTARARDAIDWPFAHSGIWSISANAVVTAGMLLACAACISNRVAARADRPVSVARTFAILGVTGYAPYVAYRGLVPLHFLFGLIATTFLVRRYAVGMSPLDVSLRTRLAMSVSGVSLLCIPAAYGVTHPLWYGSSVVTSGSYGSGEGNVYHPSTDKTVQYEFTLESSSIGKVTLLDVSGGDTPLMRVVGAAAGIVYPHERVRALAGTSLARHRTQFVTLFIRLMGCDRLSGTARLDRIHIRYRVAGMTFSQPVVLAIPPTLVCPG